MKRWTAAVVGLGKIGLGYDLTSQPEEILTHTKAFLNHPAFELVAGVDPSEEKRRAFEGYARRPAFESVDAMYNRLKPEVVALAVPTEIHLRALEAVLPHSPRFLLLEKPLAYSAAEGEKIAELLKSARIPAWVNYMRLADPTFKTFGAELRRKAYGDPLGVHVWYSKGLIHNGSHFLSLCLSWFGLPESVRLIRTQRRARRDADAEFVLLYPTFSTFFGCGQDSCYSLLEMDMLCTGGRFRLDNFGRRLDAFRVAQDSLYPQCKLLELSGAPLQPSPTRSQYLVLDEVAAGLQAQEPNWTGVEHALDVLKLCEQILQQKEAKI